MSGGVIFVILLVAAVFAFELYRNVNRAAKVVKHPVTKEVIKRLRGK